MRYFTLSLLCLGLNLGLSWTTANAGTLDTTASKDTTIFEDFPANSAGSGDYIVAGKNGGRTPSSRRGLLAFDVSAIPSTATIDSVVVELVRDFGNGPETFSLHRLTSDFGEEDTDPGSSAGQGTTALPGDATWSANFLGTSTWTTLGGDFEAVASASTLVSGNGTYSWSSAAMVSDVQSWVNGGSSNFGWMLRGNESEAVTAHIFFSREAESVAVRPRLIVGFTPVPEPSSIVLLLLGGFGFFARRRK